MRVTNDLLLRARLLGACSDLPPVGVDVLLLEYAQAVWAEDYNMLTADEIAELCGSSCIYTGHVPVSLLPQEGKGCGLTYGHGYHDGHGTGYGYSRDWGDGSASGYGVGAGQGRSYGYGKSDGSGFGETYVQASEDM